MRKGLVTSSSSSSENGDDKDLPSYYYYSNHPSNQYPHSQHQHRHQHQHHHHKHHHHHRHQQLSLQQEQLNKTQEQIRHSQDREDRQQNKHHHRHHHHHHHHYQDKENHGNKRDAHQNSHCWQEQQNQQLHYDSSLEHHQPLLQTQSSNSDSVQGQAHYCCPVGWGQNSSSSMELQPLSFASSRLVSSSGAAGMPLDDPIWKFFDDDEVIDETRPSAALAVNSDHDQQPVAVVAAVEKNAIEGAPYSLGRVRRSQISSISTTTTTLSPMSLSPPFSATLNNIPSTSTTIANNNCSNRRNPPLLSAASKTDSLTDELIPPTPPQRRFSNRLIDMYSSSSSSNRPYSVSGGGGGGGGGVDDCAFGLPDDIFVSFVGRNGSIEDSDGAGSIFTTLTQSTTLDNQSGSLGGGGGQYTTTTPFKNQQEKPTATTPAVVHRSAFGTDDDVPMSVVHLITPNPVISAQDSGMRRIASGLRLAQSQAMAVAGFLPQYSMPVHDQASPSSSEVFGDEMGTIICVDDRDCGEIIDMNSVCSLPIADIDDIGCIYDSDNSNGHIKDARNYCYSDINIPVPQKLTTETTKPTKTTLKPLPLMQLNLRQHSDSAQLTNKARHRSSYHGEGVPMGNEPNGRVGQERMVQSTPSSPFDQRRPTSFEVIGSAESLVGRVLVAEGLGKYCDPDFVAYTSREMQEALEMTREEMDLAAHQILQQHERSKSIHNGNGLKQPNLGNNKSNSNSSRGLVDLSPVNSSNRRPQSNQLLSPMSSPTNPYQQQQQPSSMGAFSGSIGSGGSTSPPQPGPGTASPPQKPNRNKSRNS